MKALGLALISVLTITQHASAATIDSNLVARIQVASARCLQKVSASDAHQKEQVILSNLVSQLMNSSDTEYIAKKVAQLKFRISELVTLSPEREDAVIQQILADASAGYYAVINSMLNAQLNGESALSNADIKALSDFEYRLSYMPSEKRATPTESSASFLKICTTTLANGGVSWFFSTGGVIKEGQSVLAEVEAIGKTNADVRQLLHSSDVQ